MSMDFKRKLPIPKEIKEQYPVTEELAKIKAQRDADIKAVFTGESDKFLLIIGPCSADNEEAVLDYMGRLKKVADEVSDKIIVIPRVSVIIFYCIVKPVKSLAVAVHFK